MSATAAMTPGIPAGNARWDDDPILTVEHLTMRFGGLVAVGDLSFNVGRGDITALIGPNGAGKTTVFNCVTGFYKPTEGRIVMRHGPGRQQEAVDAVTASGMRYKAANDGSIFLLERMPDFEISKRAKVARTFQNIRLFSGMTVLENLLVAQHNPLMVASGFTFGGIEMLRNIGFLSDIFGPAFDPVRYRMLIFGLAMVGIMVWKPRGLVTTRDPSAVLKERKKIGADLVAQGEGP